MVASWRSMRVKIRMLVGSAVGFLLVMAIGVASADVIQPSDPALPDVELAPAAVVAAGADSINLNAVARLTTYGPLIQRGTAVQLDDGRIGTVAHALIDARRASVGDRPLQLANDSGQPLVATSRLHDLSSVIGTELSASLSTAASPGVVGQQVALAGYPSSGRIVTTTGTIIARTSGVDYGFGRPDVFVISATVEQGWSGGPVVDGNGDVIAIIVGLEQRSGVTLAVPIEYLPEA